MVVDEGTLRDRTRRAVRGEILTSAMALFLSRGYEATTVEEIAQAAGISRRSFFRYFASKDDALIDGLAAIGNDIADALAARPADEGPWQALRRAFDSLVLQADTDPSAKDLGRLMLERPSLRHDKDTTWLAVIADALAARVSIPTPRPRIDAEALAAAAIACLHVAQRRWLDPDETAPLGALLDAAMRAVGPLDETRPSATDPRQISRSAPHGAPKSATRR